VAIVAGTSVASLAGDDSGRYLSLLAALAVATGIVSFLCGFLRLGWITVFLSRPILLGYIVGSGLIIAKSQATDLLGVDDISLGSLLDDLASAKMWTLAVGTATIVVVVALRRIGPRIPSYLIAMAVATSMVVLLGLRSEGVAVVGAIESGLPPIGLPHIVIGDIPSLIGPAAAIALLMYADSMLTEQSLAKDNGYDVDANQEFFALGAANVGSGLLGGFPANGSQSRSVVNAGAGARTQLSNAFAAVLLVATLLFLTPLFDELPRAALAGVVLVAAVGLIDVRALRRIWKLDRSDFALAVTTAALVVWVDVLAGILVAILLSLLDAAIKPYRARTRVLEQVPGTNRYRDADAVIGTHTVPGLLVVRLDGPIYFANAKLFADRVRELIAGTDPPPEEVLMNVESWVDIDSSAHEVLHELVDDLHARGIRLTIARARRGLQEALERSGLASEIDAFYLEVDSGVSAFLGRGSARRTQRNPMCDVDVSTD
ncbi:MAG: SulP family inorganic anion transporter, partial [Actinomycetota bacterium]|nr:SulP family inorganic anion transporter [Actinomycetota bacterium]